MAAIRHPPETGQPLPSTSLTWSWGYSRRYWTLWYKWFCYQIAGFCRKRSDSRRIESDHGKSSGHKARLVQQESQQQVAYGRHEALSEQEDAVIKGDKHVASDQSFCSGSGLPQSHDRQKERHANEDGAGFQ